MKTDNLKESFKALLESLSSAGCMSESDRDSFLSAFDKKICESAENDDSDLEAKFVEALKDAAKKLADELRGEMRGSDSSPEDGGSSEEDGDVKKMSVKDVIRDMLSSTAQENVEAFNDLVSSFSEEQKSLAAKFVEGTVDATVPDDDGTIDGDVEQFDADDDLEEACALAGSLCEALREAGLGNIAEGMMCEASGSIASLTKKMERMYEKFLKQSIRNMAKQNAQLKANGGVLMRSKREKDIGDVMKMLKRKLYLQESECKRMASKIEEDDKKICEMNGNEKNLRDLINKLENENSEIKSENLSLKESNKTLAESVESARSESAINEAKAYLTESVADLSPDMRRFLMNKFRGCNLTDVKKGFNEAVEAYRSERREDRLRLKKDSISGISRNVNEAVERNVNEEEDDLVKGFTSLSESICHKN